MHPILRSLHRAAVRTGLIAAVALIAACHSNNNSATSGAGVAWVTVGTVPNPVFTSYVVTLDSVALTDQLGNTYTALSNPQPVDLVKLRDIRELWGSGTIPNDSYKSATITVDYSNAAVFVLVNGVPQRAAVLGPNGAAVTTRQVIVNLDAAQPLVIVPSYSTDNAVVLALNFDLLASNAVNLSTSPATVTVNPLITAALAPPDNELIRVRGPLVNSSLALGTFTIYERPFYDQASGAGELTVFNDNNTLFTLDGVAYSGSNGLNQLSQLPAGVTLTETYTTFEPTGTSTAFAGKFNTVYVVGGASVQSTLTENISGDVIAISTNASTGVRTLTLRGATVYGPQIALQEGYFGYQASDAQLLVGPATVVTVDDNATLTGLGYNSIAVGDHIEAVATSWTCTGVCGTSGLGVWQLDATDAATGKVRLQPTPIVGELQSASAGSLTMALQSINYWPASDFNFAGNGSSVAGTPTAAAFTVSASGTNLSAVSAGTPLLVTGLVNSFGQAPPDFIASQVTSLAPSSTAIPATLYAQWSNGGTLAPFSQLSDSGFTIDLANPNLVTAVLQAGSLTVPLNTLGTAVQVNTLNTPISLTAQPLYSPHYAYSTLASVGGVEVPTVHVFVTFAKFLLSFGPALTQVSQAFLISADGTYDAATGTFYANTVSIVL